MNSQLIWTTESDVSKAQGVGGIKFFIFRAPHEVGGCGRNYALRIEFNRDGAWIRSDDVLDDPETPTICRDQAEKIHNAIFAAISTAVSEAENKWVSVSERLPEIGEYVIWLHPTNYRSRPFRQFIALYEGHHGTCTHWMALPASPEEKRA